MMRRILAVALLIFAFVVTSRLIASADVSSKTLDLAALTTLVGQVHPELIAKRATLAGALVTYNGRVRQFNADCGAVDSNDVNTVQNCTDRQSQLDAQERDLASKIAAYNADVRETALGVDQMQLARLDEERQSLQRQMTILERVRAQQRGSDDEMNRLRQDLLQDGMIDAVGFAANSAFLHGLGLSPKSARIAAKALLSYQVALNLLASKNALDEAERTGDTKTRRSSEEKAFEAVKETAKELATIAMPRAAAEQIFALVDSAHEVFKEKQNLSDEHTLIEKGAIALDGFSRVAAAWDPRLKALRTGGDIVAGAGLYLKLSWDQQSVHDADNSAKYAMGLVSTHMDSLKRQRDAMQVQVQRDQGGQ